MISCGGGFIFNSLQEEHNPEERWEHLGVFTEKCKGQNASASPYWVWLRSGRGLNLFFRRQLFSMSQAKSLLFQRNP